MTTFTKRNTLLASALAFGLLAALPLSQAVAQNEHEGHHPQNAPAAARQGQGQQMPQGGMMDHSQMGHGGMSHEQMMQQMHEQHMNNGQMDHGNMGQGQMNHGSMPPAKAAPQTKDGKNGQ
jgi:hypothetical protein